MSGWPVRYPHFNRAVGRRESGRRWGVPHQDFSADGLKREPLPVGAPDTVTILPPAGDCFSRGHVADEQEAILGCAVQVLAVGTPPDAPHRHGVAFELEEFLARLRVPDAH